MSNQINTFLLVIIALVLVAAGVWYIARQPAQEESDVQLELSVPSNNQSE